VNTNNVQSILSAALETSIRVEISRDALGAAELSAAERVRVNQFCHAQRREDWLRGRRALHCLMQSRGMPPDTSLLEFPHAEISLTHSTDVAIAAGAKGVAGVGIDYECWREVQPRMARWFLLAQEQAWLERLSPPRIGRELLRLWTVKEALFKACPQNAGLVLADIHMPNPDRATGVALIPTRKSLRFRYTSLVMETGVLSLALAKEQ
jgi:4'-phosphopantetheinyl transferase EntD